MLPPFVNGLDPDRIACVAEMAQMPNVGVCLDSGHAHLAGYCVAAAVRRIDKLLFETHFHDNCGPVPSPLPDRTGDMHLPVGLGTINWFDVHRALDETGFGGPVTFEVGPCFGREIEGYRRALEITAASWRAVEDIVCSARCSYSATSDSKR